MSENKVDRVYLSEGKLVADLNGRNEEAPKPEQLALLIKWAMYANKSDIAFVIDGFIKRADSRREYAQKQKASNAVPVPAPQSA